MKKTFINRTVMVMAAAGGLMLTSCSDHDMFNPNYKAEEYAANWNELVGKIDPNQDWSMATVVTAKANVPGTTGNSVLSIYTENPVHSTSKLLAKTVLENGNGSVLFDAVKGMDQVFCIVNNNGKNVVYGWADIVNGTVDASKTVAKKAARTRAASCPVTKGGTENLISIKTRNPEKDVVTKTTKIVKGEYNGNPLNYKTFDEWVTEITKAMNDNASNGMFYLNPNNSGWPFTKESMVTYKGNAWEAGFEYTYHPSSEWQLADGWKYMEIETGRVDGYDELNIDVTLLNGVEKKEVQEPWTLAWGIELFGQGGFFQEQKPYWAKRELMTELSLDDVEKGFSIVSEGGEITLPFIYGSTGIANRFGYVYYKDGEDPLTQPHYIVMENGKPSNNIYKYSWRGTAVGDMDLANLVGAYGSPGDPSMEIYGTEYKLTYFDENGNATYNFPAGYNIVFFVAPYNGTYTVSNFNYSLPELNKRIKHMDAIYKKDEYPEGNPNYNPERGAIKATAWKYNGNVFLGFEDGGGDEDLNDIVFWVEGNYTPNEEVPEVPSTTQPKEESQSWILACEDLGSNDDYDFNDIVLEIRQNVKMEETFEGDKKTGETFKEAKLEVRCLAAGGIYAANISYDDRVDVGESHALLGGTVGNMYNTKGLGKFSEWKTLETVNDESAWKAIQNNNSWSINTIVGKIKIVVTTDDNVGNASLIKAPATGEAPQMIIVPGDWQWPTERTKIYDAYPGFKNWNSDATLTDWNSVKVAANVINR